MTAHRCGGCGEVVCAEPGPGPEEDCPEVRVGPLAHWCGRCEWWDAPHGALIPGAEGEREADERAYDLAVNASTNEARETGRRPRPVARHRSAGGWR